jgi:Transcriptional regulatory protein, C terminal
MDSTALSVGVTTRDEAQRLRPVVPEGVALVVMSETTRELDLVVQFHDDEVIIPSDYTKVPLIKLRRDDHNTLALVAMISALQEHWRLGLASRSGFDPANSTFRRDDNTVATLTNVESKLLSILFDKRGRLINREVIQEGLWHEVSEATSMRLDVHVRRLREKIEIDPSQPVHLVTLRSRGYRLV